MKQRQIVVFVDQQTREVLMHFPIPKDGIVELSAPLPGESCARLPHMNQEQKAHYVFWSDGTQERINELIKNGKGAGLRQTLTWLINMRIAETVNKTSWRYHLLVTTDRSKWEERVKL